MLEGSGTQSCQFCDIYKKAGKLVFVDNTEAVYDGIIWLFCYNNWYTFLLTSGTRLTRTPKGHATVFVLSRCPYKAVTFARIACVRNAIKKYGSPTSFSG